jgi:Domain of unknown function (DUF6602)
MDKHDHLKEQMLSRFAPGPATITVQRLDGIRTKEPVGNRLFLAERFSRILQADMDWFEQVISHQPTVGAFYEIMLRNTLKELAPAGCEIATGFVLDPYRPIHSKQLDIVAYDHTQSSPVFRSGDLVVVRPSPVISVTEVKKTLRMRDIEQAIDGTFFSNLGTRLHSLGGAFEGVQSLNIFGFSSKLKPQEIADNIRDYLDSKIRYTRIQHRKTKRRGVLYLKEIVLPNIFVRNDRFYITSFLRPTKEGSYSYKIEIDVHESPEVNGCIGAYLSNALPIPQHDQNAFISHNFEVVKKSLQTIEHLQLHTTISMADVDAFFSRDSRKIRKFHVKGRAPVAVSIPKDLSWKNLATSDDFVQTIGKENFETEVD